MLPAILGIDAVVVLVAGAGGQLVTGIVVALTVTSCWLMVTLRRRNAAGPGWAATYTGAAWLVVRWASLVSVDAVKLREQRGAAALPSFLCRDADGGWATLVPRLAGWPQIVAVAAPDLLAAQQRGVALPEELLGELTQPTDVRSEPGRSAQADRPFF